MMVSSIRIITGFSVTWQQCIYIYDSVTNVGGSIFLHISTTEGFSMTRQLYDSVTNAGGSIFLYVSTIE